MERPVMTELRRPEVTLVASSRPLRNHPPDERPASARHAWWRLAAAAFVLLLAGAGLSPPEPVAQPGLSAVLVPQPDGVTLSQGGVLVLPLELRNPGPALQVSDARAYAEPVVDDAVVQAPDEVVARGLRRFVALIAPDCRLLRPGSPIGFRASVRLSVRAEGATQELVVDLAAVPGVRETVTGLCG